MHVTMIMYILVYVVDMILILWRNNRDMQTFWCYLSEAQLTHKCCVGCKTLALVTVWLKWYAIQYRTMSRNDILNETCERSDLPSLPIKHLSSDLL